MGSNDPAAWGYWKREASIYQAGLLDELPGGIVAPRCYAVVERPEGTVWLWLEDVASTPTTWDLTRHGEVARHFGRFNGAYLAGHPPPKAEPWLSWGRARPWVEWSASWVANSRQYVDTPVGRQLFGQSGLERTLRLWQSVPQLLEGFERLPVCFCHHDAYRRNLLDRPPGGSDHATVAIDWALAGFGRVGEEVGAMSGLNLVYLEVPASQARDLDRAIFGGYVDGLRAAGWRGPEQLARFGYAVNTFVLIGITWNLSHLEELQQPEAVTAIEELLGHPVDAILAQWAETMPYTLDLGEEACRLADKLWN